MTTTPSADPTFHSPEYVDTHGIQGQKKANMVPIVVILFCLLSGIVLVAAGIGVGEVAWTSGLGVILVVGVLLLVAAVGARYLWIDDYLPEVSTALALYIAIEFLAGVALTYVGLVNLSSETTDVDWILMAITAFGLFLVGDSVIFYRKAFKRAAGD